MMKIPNFLKRPIAGLLLFLGMTIGFSSCSDDDDLIVITIDDAAELVAYSLANQTYGVVNDLNYVADEVLTRVDCGQSETNTWSFAETGPGGEISVTSDISESYSKNCDGEETIQYTYNADQVLTSVRFDQVLDIDGDWSVQGVQNGSTELIYNGPYNRNGTVTYNLSKGHTETVDYLSTLINLRYDTNAGRITAGVSTFAIEGTSTEHDGYSYAGDVAFNGADLAIITFSSGEQYELNLETGDITKL
ncbi:MAG: hypothetical protein AAFV80_08830 [Bacteroidota bacterium]